MKRGTVRKSRSTLVTVWVPHHVVGALDAAVEVEDSDRSKFMRRALREKLSRLGIPVPEKEVA